MQYKFEIPDDKIAEWARSDFSDLYKMAGSQGDVLLERRPQGDVTVMSGDAPQEHVDRIKRWLVTRGVFIWERRAPKPKRR